MGTLEVIYDYESIKADTSIKKRKFDKKASMYQFDFLLPTIPKLKLDEYVGGTPLYKFDLLGMKDVLVKYDGSNPSSSYKDRASSIAINKAIDEGNDILFCASTGNAASSLAMLNANTEMKTYIFRVAIEEDPFEDGKMAYHAYCPSLKGASTWGHTKEEAMKNIREVVEMTVESMIEHGELIPEDPDVQIFSELRVAVTV